MAHELKSITDTHYTLNAFISVLCLNASLHHSCLLIYLINQLRHPHALIELYPVFWHLSFQLRHKCFKLVPIRRPPGFPYRSPFWTEAVMLLGRRETRDFVMYGDVVEVMGSNEAGATISKTPSLGGSFVLLC